MSIEVKIAPRGDNKQGVVVGAVEPGVPGAFRDYDPNSPSLISVMCSEDGTQGQVYRIRDIDFLKTAQVRLIPADLYNEENLEATLEPGSEPYTSDIVSQAGHAASLVLTLLTP